MNIIFKKLYNSWQKQTNPITEMFCELIKMFHKSINIHKIPKYFQLVIQKSVVWRIVEEIQHKICQLKLRYLIVIWPVQLIWSIRNNVISLSEIQKIPHKSSRGSQMNWFSPDLTAFWDSLSMVHLHQAEPIVVFLSVALTCYKILSGW